MDNVSQFPNKPDAISNFLNKPAHEMTIKDSLVLHTTGVVVSYVVQITLQGWVEIIRGTLNKSRRYPYSRGRNTNESANRPS